MCLPKKPSREKIWKMIARSAQICLLTALWSALVPPNVWAAGDATLSFDPDEATVKKGETLTVKVTLDTGGQAVGGVAVYITYPSDKLEITAEKITKGSKFDSEVKDLKTGVAGINVVNYSSATGVTGTNELVATFVFTTKAEGEVTLTFATGTKIMSADASPQDLTSYDDLEDMEGLYEITASGTTQTHLECRNNVCTQVTGAGANTGGCTTVGQSCGISDSSDDDEDEDDSNSDDEPETGVLENTLAVLAASLGLVALGIVTPRFSLATRIKARVLSHFERKITQE